MKLKALLTVLLGLEAACFPALVVKPRVFIGPALSTTARSAPADQERAPATPSIPLPGKGLAQHPFLYCGEWDTRKPVQTMYIVRGGKVVWSYSIPNQDELDDIHMLS